MEPHPQVTYLAQLRETLTTLMRLGEALLHDEWAENPQQPLRVSDARMEAEYLSVRLWGCRVSAARVWPPFLALDSWVLADYERLAQHAPPRHVKAVMEVGKGVAECLHLNACASAAAGMDARAEELWGLRTRVLAAVFRLPVPEDKNTPGGEPCQ